MASNARILCKSDNRTYKPNQAKRWIADCSYVWVEEGVSIRKLSPTERIQARDEQKRLEEPLAHVEIPGIRFEPLTHDLASTSHCRIIATASSFLFGAKIHMHNNPDALQLIDTAANQFCLEHA